MTPEVTLLLQAILEGKELQVNDWGDEWKDCNTDHALYKIGLDRANQIRIKPERHPHQDLIDQWKNGAIIQFKDSKNGWFDTKENKPLWYTHTEYRVKPEPVLNVTYSGFYRSDKFGFFSVFDSYEIINSIPKEITRNRGYWNLVGIIKTTVDVETSKILSVENIPITKQD